MSDSRVKPVDSFDYQLSALRGATEIIITYCNGRDADVIITSKARDA